MTQRILVSRGLPQAALDMIPRDVDVDYNGFERALSKAELMSRLKGRHGLICHIVDAVETALVKEALTITNGNQVKASELLGLNRATLRKKAGAD